jgi:hypothetical protein
MPRISRVGMAMATHLRGARRLATGYPGRRTASRGVSSSVSRHKRERDMAEREAQAAEADRGVAEAGLADSAPDS